MGTRPTLLAALAIAALLACDDDDAEQDAGPAEPMAEGVSRPSGGIEGDDERLARAPEPSEPSAPEKAAPEKAAALQGAPAEGRCVSMGETALRIWPGGGPAAVVSQGDRFVVAGYAPQDRGHELFVVGVRPDAAPVPLGTVMLHGTGDARIAPPGLARVDEETVAVAVIDRRGEVRVGDVATANPGSDIALAAVGAGADLRFSPAVAVLGRRRVVAWTTAGHSMRVKLAVVVDGEVQATHDVTPQAMGASAPTFAESVTPPELFFVDARAGVSPILRVRLGADGTPGEAMVAKPVGAVTTPPRLAVARAGGSLYAGYTVIGNAATTAVGWIRLDAEDASPAAIVPGTGYGSLHVAAVSAPEAAIFAADAPQGSPREAPREIHLRAVRRDGPGPVLTVQSPGGRGAHAALARRGDGMLAVVFTGEEAVYVAWARCDDGMR